jgi:hypothetical protein
MHTVGTVLTCGRIPDHLERGQMCAGRSEKVGSPMIIPHIPNIACEEIMEAIAVRTHVSMSMSMTVPSDLTKLTSTQEIWCDTTPSTKRKLRFAKSRSGSTRHAKQISPRSRNRPPYAILIICIPNGCRLVYVQLQIQGALQEKNRIPLRKQHASPT